MPKRQWLLLLASALLLVASPLPMSVARADVPSVENLGVAIRDYSVLDSVTAYNPTLGKDIQYGATYVVNDDGVYFFGVDNSGAVVISIFMANSYGPYHVAADANGNIYAGTLEKDGQGRLWRYDPVTGVLAVVSTPSTGVPTAWVFGLDTAPNGDVFMGVAPVGKLYKWTAATGVTTDLGVVTPGNSYPKAIEVLPVGGGTRVLVGSGSPASLTVVDTSTGTRTNVLPAAYAGYSFAYNVERSGSDVFVQMVTPDNRMLYFTDTAAGFAFQSEIPVGASGSWGAAVLRRDATSVYLTGQLTSTGQSGIFVYDLVSHALTYQASANSPKTWQGRRLNAVTIGGDTWITSIGLKGLWGRWNPSTGALVTGQLPLIGAPTNITALKRGPDGKIYGGTYETMRMFSYDPSVGGAPTELGNFAPTRSGEALSMAYTPGKLFIGSYTDAVLTVYQTGGSWSPGSGAGSNPRDLGPIGSQQYRPWDMVVDGGSGDVWVTTSAAYGVVGGALTKVDPSTYATTTYRYLAGNQHLFSLETGACPALCDELYVGTSNFGDGTTVAGDAQLLVFNRTSGTVVWSTVPVPGANRITALTRAANGLVYGAADGSWFEFNPVTRTVTNLGAFPYGPILGLITGFDGQVYGHTFGPPGGTVFKIATPSRTVTSLASCGSMYFRTMDQGLDGKLYWGCGPNLYRLTPP